MSPSQNFENSYVGVFKLINNPKKAQFKGDMKKFLQDKDEEEMGDVKGIPLKTSMKLIYEVASLFLTFLKEENPNRMIFHARNDDRAKHYKKIGDELAKQSGYKLINKKDNSTGLTEFHLVKNEDDLIKESLELFKHFT
jgi:hypothetical protein